MEEKIYLIITQDNLIKEIADREDIDVAIVRDVFSSAESIIFDHLSSTAPSENVIIKILNGISIEGKYIPSKEYSRGIFKNIHCPEKIKIKASSSKYYNKKINDEIHYRRMCKQ